MKESLFNSENPLEEGQCGCRDTGEEAGIGVQVMNKVMMVMVVKPVELGNGLGGRMLTEKVGKVIFVQLDFVQLHA